MTWPTRWGLALGDQTWRPPLEAVLRKRGGERSNHFAPKGRRRHPRHRREVRRQPGHRHRLDVGAHRHQPGALGLRPATLAVLRLRRRQRPVRLRLEPFASFDHPQDRQGPAAVSRRRGFGRLHPLRRRRPGAGVPAGPRRNLGRRPSGYQRDADGFWVRDPSGRLVVHEDELDGYRVRRYRPRIEGLFARIERWSKIGAPSDVHWRSISKDNILTLYGLDANSRIADPLDASRIFTWLICETRDDKGNAVLYRYKAEDGLGVDLEQCARAQPRAAERRPPHGQPLPQAHPLRQPHAAARQRRASPSFPGQAADRRPDRQRRLDVRGGVRLRRARCGRPADDAETTTGAWILTAPGPVLLLSLGLRGPHLPPVPARVDVPSLPGRGRRRSATAWCARPTSPTRTKSIPPTSATRSTPSCEAVTQTGYRRNNGGYDKRSLPPVEFEYTEPIVQDAVEEVDPAEPGEPAHRPGRQRLPLDRPARRRHPRHPHRAGRRLVLQAQPQPDPGQAARRPGTGEGDSSPRSKPSPSNPTSR